MVLCMIYMIISNRSSQCLHNLFTLTILVNQYYTHCICLHASCGCKQKRLAWILQKRLPTSCKHTNRSSSRQEIQYSLKCDVSGLALMTGYLSLISGDIQDNTSPRASTVHQNTNTLAYIDVSNKMFLSYTSDAHTHKLSLQLKY